MAITSSAPAIAYPVAAIRAGEATLLAAEPEPDYVMRQAASAVARVAERVLGDVPLGGAAPGDAGCVLLLVGSGGNGGDALYAGAELASRGASVVALLTGRDDNGNLRVHQRALDAFRTSGGVVIDSLDELGERSIALVIDGLLGLGARGGLHTLSLGAHIIEWLSKTRPRVIAVDIPSGVNPDSGEYRDDDHIEATATVTFGGLRLAHVLAGEVCGEITLVDLAVGKNRLSTALTDHDEAAHAVPVFRAPIPAGASSTLAPLSPPLNPPLNPAEPAPIPTTLEPGAKDDKYSGGVVGMCAGSPMYPGAGVLATAGAVNATSSMVRYIGRAGDRAGRGEDRTLWEVIHTHPEVVGHPSLGEAGRVQALVVGPGRGTDDIAAHELAEALATDHPLLIDADALTLLSRSPELQAAVRIRTATTLITPHAGEFDRLHAALHPNEPPGHRIEAARGVAKELGVTVLLKGRWTVVARTNGAASVVDAGSSWAATPGSGDVLAGVLGAWMARAAAHGERADAYVELAARIHAVAAWLSARTEFGPAPTSASRIAAHVREATALIIGGTDAGKRYPIN